jgi:outer membrane protein TolC
LGARAQQAVNFQGSVPTGPAGAAIDLTLDGAIERGLRANLGVLESGTASDTVRAQRIQALSALLPQVTGSMMAVEEQINLKTFGFNFNFPSIPALGFNGIPSVVGPFHYTMAQANVSMTAFDYNKLKTLKAARERESAARLTVEDARDLVAQAVANGYLLIIADASRTDALEAQVKTAQALYERASDQKKAGVSPSIDVLRSEVELKQDEQRLLAQRNQFAKDKLALGRLIGLPPGQEFQIANQTPFARFETMPPEQADALAYRQRADYLSAKHQVAAAEQTVRAATGEWYPTVGVNGYYGDAGVTPNNSHGVFEVAGTVNFNIFDGGRIRGDIEKARAALKQSNDELADLGAQIDYQVRAALLDVKTAADQVAVARSNLDLANQTLDQARDRFVAGVTDNIEVVQAQESVASANDNLIAALYAHNVAKAALARALGSTAETIKKFIEVK